MRPEEFLQKAKTITEEVLSKEFMDKLSEAIGVHKYLKELVDYPRDYTLRGGKRLRAMLILAGYYSLDPSLPIEPIKHVMASIEFLQSYFLAHDDIMDRDVVRRGGPTLHVMYEKYCREKGLLGDCAHYGISQAILAGDYLEALAVGMLASAPLPHERVVKLVQRYVLGLRTVAYGQYLDVLFAYMKLRDVREEHVLKVHELKTASYTVEMPLHLGAIAAGINDPKIYELYTRMAKPAGIAFQLRDDIIGLYGDPSVTGKPVGSDVKEKKKTLLVIKAYELASSDDKKFLEEIYDLKRPEEISIEDIERVRAIVKETGSLDYSEEIIKKYYEEALGVLEESKIHDNVKELLRWLLKKLVYREK